MAICFFVQEVYRVTFWLCYVLALNLNQSSACMENIGQRHRNGRHTYTRKDTVENEFEFLRRYQSPLSSLLMMSSSSSSSLSFTFSAGHTLIFNLFSSSISMTKFMLYSRRIEQDRRTSLSNRQPRYYASRSCSRGANAAHGCYRTEPWLFHPDIDWSD